MSLQPSAEPTVPAAGNDATRWFTEEVQPNDPSLRAYLRRAFPSVRDVDDLVQESYVRIWRKHTTHPVQSARAFLFQVARRLAIDVVRRRRTSRIESVPDLAALPVAAAERSGVDAAILREEVELLTQAIHALPPRCREVMILRKIEGRSQREIAARLGLAEGTVQVHIVQGLRRLEGTFMAYRSPFDRP